MNRMLFRAFGVAWILAWAWSLAPAEASDALRWQPMLAKSFKGEARDLPVSDLVVYRNTGCVFLLVKGKVVYCSSAGANAFKPVNETWKQVCDKKTKDAKHRFKLTAGGIKESADGGATWSRPIPAPRDFIITSQTWFGYDARNDVLYLMKAGRDLYKLARGNIRADGPMKVGEIAVQHLGTSVDGKPLVLSKYRGRFVCFACVDHHK